MNNSQLEEQWQSLEEQSLSSEANMLRLSSACKADLFIAFNQDNQRCLLLLSEEVPPLRSNGIIKTRLSLNWDNDNKHLVLTLLDSGYIKLFDDLVVSLHNAINSAVSDASYTSIFLNTFQQWVEFFEVDKQDRLTLNEIKGLFGEMWLLQQLIELKQQNAPSILAAWKGPFDQGQDFVFDDEHLEVKSIDEGRNIVKISSEFQLDVPTDKNLLLVVLHLVSASDDSKSLKELFFEIKELLLTNLSDISPLYKALYQKGIHLGNIHLYDNYRFEIIRKTVFDATSEEFPKLSRHNIAKAISGVRYTLGLSSLKKYIVEESDY